MLERTIEVLFFDGCPGHEQLLDRLPRLLEDAGIRAALAAHHDRPPQGR
jgi:hypothetical protein